MKKTQELESIQNLFYLKCRAEKQDILFNSNLNDRETELLSFRLVQGKTLKECADHFGIEEDSVNKAQLKAVRKLYIFLCNGQKMYK